MNIKRVLSFILAAVTLGAAAVSCGEQADQSKLSQTAAPDNDGAVAETEAPETSADDVVREIFGDDDFGGYEFHLLGYKPGGHFYGKINAGANEMWYEEQTGDIYDDAVYERNTRTEELLNVKITPIFVDDVQSSLKKLVMSGDQSADAALGPLAYNMDLAASGYLVNLLTVSSLGLSQPWFDQAIIKNYSYRGKQLYAVTGAGNIFDDYAVPVVFYGRDILTRYGLDDPADIVSDGKWTIETMMTMGEKVTADVDGDGKMTNSDSYGFLDNTGEMVHLMEGTGYTMTGVGDDGVPYANCFRPGYVDAAEYIYNRVIKSPALWHGANGIAVGIMKENRALFYYELLGCINEFRDMESSFSLLPCPKLDEKQETYVSAINSVWCTSYSIPVTTPDAERTGAVLSALNGFSVNTVNSVLYELLLGAKLVREEKTQEMLTVILSSKKYDWGNGYSWSGGISNILNAQVSSKTFTLASKLESQSEKIQKSLDKFLAKFDELDA